MLPAEPNETVAVSSESSGVGRGGGNWMLVRSGREPPLLWAPGFRDVAICCSGVGNMLQETDNAVNPRTLDWIALVFWLIGFLAVKLIKCVLIEVRWV